MKRVKSPYIAMSGVELGYGLSKLTQQLLEFSHVLMSVNPNEETLNGSDSDRVWHIACQGSDVIPTIRARLHRYATLAIAKWHPDLEMLLPKEIDDRWCDIRLKEEQETPVSIAQEIFDVCEELMDSKTHCHSADMNADGRRMEDVFHRLDVALERHAHVCSTLWVKLLELSRKLEENDDCQRKGNAMSQKIDQIKLFTVRSTFADKGYEVDTQEAVSNLVNEWLCKNPTNEIVSIHFDFIDTAQCFALVHYRTTVEPEE